jgi:hypothetical protein
MECAVNHLQTTELTMQLASLQVNEAVLTVPQVEWWGNADELLTGTSDFAHELPDFSPLMPHRSQRLRRRGSSMCCRGVGCGQGQGAADGYGLGSETF